MRNDWEAGLEPFLTKEELGLVTPKANSATHLLANQGQALAALHKQGNLDLFHQISLMEIVRELYAMQGKAERIKQDPATASLCECCRSMGARAHKTWESSRHGAC